MPIVKFHPLGLEVEARENETILDAARRAGAPLGASCGAVGICARCRVRVVEGADALTPITTIEARTIVERALAAEERLACQAVVEGNCTVGATYW